MLKVENLHFSYDETEILKGVSFHVKDGQLCGLFGPNGSGKTTLFKCCLNFLKSYKGEVIIRSENVKHKKVQEMAKLVAYVPQEHKPPFPYLVKEVILMGRTPHLGGVFGICRKDKEKTINAMELLGILDLADKPYNHLSGGQRQLVLIARAVAQETQLLFLDEPTSALDFSNQLKIWKILQKIAKKGRTILACTHEPNHVMWFCNHVLVMGDKGIVANGHPHDSINNETLGRIYGNVCDVRNLDTMKIVVPSNTTSLYA